jgi:hypothetical protein
MPNSIFLIFKPFNKDTLAIIETDSYSTPFLLIFITNRLFVTIAHRLLTFSMVAIGSVAKNIDHYRTKKGHVKMT